MNKPANVVLLVDDEPKIRRFLRAGFELNGFFVLEAENATDALKLVGSVPLVSLVLASGGTRLGALAPDHVIYVEANASDKDVAEMFDKYNLLTLPVVDEEQRLAGIITADDIISLLRAKL